MKNCNEFGKRLREAREKAGLTQTELAEKAQISPQMVSAYEGQAKFPAVKTAAAIAAVLNVSLDYLCGLSQNTSKAPSISTYADAIRYMAELAKYFDCSCKKIDRQLPEECWETVTNGNIVGGVCEEHTEEITTEPVAVINIANYQIAAFVERWSEISKLFTKKVIPSELLDSWYVGELEKLSKFPTIAPNNKAHLWFIPGEEEEG